MQVSFHVQFVTRTKSLVFLLFVLLLLYISCKKKLFIEEFFMEDYIQEI